MGALSVVAVFGVGVRETLPMSFYRLSRSLRVPLQGSRLPKTFLRRGVSSRSQSSHQVLGRRSRRGPRPVGTSYSPGRSLDDSVLDVALV